MSGGSKAQVSERATRAAELVRQLVADEEFRGQLQRSAGYAVRANRRMRSHFGLLASLRQVTNDQQLRAELQQLMEELHAATKQAEKKRRHRLRRSLFLIAGTGAAIVVIVPRSRQRLRDQAQEPRDTPDGETRTVAETAQRPASSPRSESRYELARRVVMKTGLRGGLTVRSGRPFLTARASSSSGYAYTVSGAAPDPMKCRRRYEDAWGLVWNDPWR